MRRRALLGPLFFVLGCSRGPAPSSAADPPPPVAKEATLTLATAVEDQTDGGETKAEEPAPPSLTGKTVLHVGDSMVGGEWGLTRALQKKFEAEGAKFVHSCTVSESIVSFDKSTKLKDLLTKNKPDIVIITLGTNDALVPYPAALASNVKNIVSRLDGRECYWMGPPLWKPDTGILAVIRDNVGRCKFYDSSKLTLQRGHDGIHPTEKGGADWADSFWTYFRAQPTLTAAVTDPR
jgi:hypothetical protein